MRNMINRNDKIIIRRMNMVNTETKVKRNKKATKLIMIGDGNPLDSRRFDETHLTTNLKIQGKKVKRWLCQFTAAWMVQR